MWPTEETCIICQLCFAYEMSNACKLSFKRHKSLQRAQLIKALAMTNMISNVHILTFPSLELIHEFSQSGKGGK